MGLTVCLTHDVDRVYKTYHYLTRDLRGGHLRRLRTLFTGESPFWRFEALMAAEDRHGARSTFFFLEESIPFEPLRPARWKLSAGRYSYRDPRVAGVIRALDAGGWEIGVHGSYRSYRDGGLLRREKASLEEVLGRPVTGIRQHYLNLDVPETWRLQRAAGFRYDASLGRRSGIGFPDGRDRPFRDPDTGMVVIPLGMMESYLFRQAGGDPERAWTLTRGMIDAAERDGSVL
ncbi:MAG TPA: polysaccharide deacetylase family protein, partial [Longimicrobium sp.]|nr:polysaccharide deacetylase family protein [Longimicrobium sp.]